MLEAYGEEMSETRTREISSGSRPDRRVTKTHRALKQALRTLVLERSYESIAVQDLLDRADVGRSTFYAHYLDKDDLLIAVFRDLGAPAPDPSAWGHDDPPFAWAEQFFEHFREGKPIFRAVTRSRAGGVARQETDQWLRSLVDAELHRLGVPRTDPRVSLTVDYAVSALLALMTWWVTDPNVDVSAEQVSGAFRRLVLPGVLEYLDIARPERDQH